MHVSPAQLDEQHGPPAVDAMSKHWKEKLDPQKHRDHMDPARVEQVDPLVERWAYFVRVCGFTFKFVSIQQLRECLAHFSQKLHPSGRLVQPRPGGHSVDPWHERLPMRLFEESKRQRVVKALTRALNEFEAGASEPDLPRPLKGEDGTDGATAARRDIAAGDLRYKQFGPWFEGAEQFRQIVSEGLGMSVDFLFNVTHAQHRFARAYNAVVRHHLVTVHGRDVIAEALAESKELYGEYLERLTQPERKPEAE